MKRLLIFLSTILIVILCVFLSFKEKSINLDKIDLINSKDALIEKEFDDKYKISIKENTNTKLEKEIKELSRKTTYLLLGDFKETSEEYYERHKNFIKLRYSSDDEIDSFVSSESTEYMFNKLSEYNIKFSSIGDIKVSESKNFVISTVILPSITLKVESNTNPYKYEEKSSNLIITYYFKKYKKDYKLYYLSSEFKSSLYNAVTSFAIKSSDLNEIYNFKDLKNINNSIYENNKNNIMKLTSYRVNEELSSSIGILIDNNLLITSYKFVNDALANGDFISIKTVNNKNVNYDGFVTMNKKYNYAVIKLSNNYISSTVVGDIPKIEDGVLEISNIDNDISTNKSIVISNKNNIKTTGDDYNNSILFDKNSKLIGLSINNEYINSSVLNEVKKVFNNKKITTVSFNDLKNKYYIDDTEYKEKNLVLPDNLLRYKIIKNIDKDINIPLVNYSKEGNNISLKYKNTISKYMDSMSIFNSLKDNFSDCKKIVSTDNKEIYDSSKYKIIATTEFDYLIIVVVIK